MAGSASRASRWAWTPLLALFVSGCLGGAPPAERDTPPSPVGVKDPLWVRWLDPDYFEYEEFDRFQMAIPAPPNEASNHMEVQPPKNLTFLSVRARLYVMDPSLPYAAAEKLGIEGNWSNGTKAFRIDLERCCWSATGPARYNLMDEGQALVRLPPDSDALTFKTVGTAPNMYVEVSLEEATPDSLKDGPPPYVRLLDLAYFEYAPMTSARVDFPEAAANDPTPIDAPVSTNASYVHFVLEYYRTTGAGTQMFPANPAMKDPRILALWDTGEEAFDSFPDYVGNQLESRFDVQEFLVLLPPQVHAIHFETEGWGHGLYAEIRIESAWPMDPLA